MGEIKSVVPVNKSPAPFSRLHYIRPGSQGIPDSRRFEKTQEVRPAGLVLGLWSQRQKGRRNPLPLRERDQSVMVRMGLIPAVTVWLTSVLTFAAESFPTVSGAVMMMGVMGS